MSQGAPWIAAIALGITASGIVAVASCSPKNDRNNGVNDVGAACATRASWKNALREKCINCMVGSTSPPCECESFKEFAGLCRGQAEDRSAEPSCTAAVKDCANNCPKSDCGCLERCYAAAEGCKRASAAVDGCVTDVCAPHCQ